jgi:hypothetical protein
VKERLVAEVERLKGVVEGMRQVDKTPNGNSDTVELFAGARNRDGR